MAILVSKPKIHKLSGEESAALDAAFGSADDFDDSFFVGGNISDGALTVNDAPSPPPRIVRGDKMLPIMLTTDVPTATQVLMLLEMLRYCMENSKEVIDSTTGEAKEYEIKVRVRNRGKSGFIVSVGDEPLGPIPVPEGGCFVGS